MYPKQCKLLNYLEPRQSYNQGKVFGLTKWRKEVLARDKNKCQNCFNSIKDTFRDREAKNEAHHIIPRYHGGKNTLNNGVTNCIFCHDYFDLMYFKYGLDYYEAIKKKSAEQRIREVRELLEERYYSHLLNIILNG